MSTKSTNNTLKFLTIVLTILLLSLGLYTIKFYNEVKDNQAQLLQEKALILEELQQEVDRYNVVLRENTSITSRLEEAKSEVLQLREQLKTQEATRDVVKEYQLELGKLRREREVIFKQNDSLIQETQRLSQLQQETQERLDKATQKQDSIQDQNRDLASKLSQGGQVTARLSSVRAVIQRNNGKFTPTVRARRAEMIQVNYIVNQNILAKAGELPFYTQVKGPDGRIIGTPRSVSFDNGSTLLYNNRVIVPYDKTDFKVNDLILGSGSFEEGVYEIFVYQGARNLIKTTLELK